MRHIIDQIITMHRIGDEINKRVPSCGMGMHQSMQWHILNFQNFQRAAASLNNGQYEVQMLGEGNYYPYKYSFVHRGVEVFCLSQKKEV